ncbi:MAG TPA: IS1595 family transposase [Ramlibacter sp.]|uniref:IS1595 family transposase n=1 Tax=Ramlibacter sp. TaxID=1917967 RepID=UPI002D7E6000|nr:IS1595 family transposase [Ramlibacter sp.]HET8746645.1 IS1595 family transposase [Ramlibacter sp.]
MNTTALTLGAFTDLFPDEDAARTWFERARWPDGPICPVCGCVDRACWLRTVRRWECMACRRQFTVTAGTPMHRTHLPLLTWAQAIYLIAAASKGVSAVKLSEMLGVSYATAWHLGHRIRAMMAEDNPLLANVVEIDETSAGAPPRKRAKPEHTDGDRAPPPNPKGRGTRRPLLLVAAERGGDVVAFQPTARLPLPKR